MSWGTANAPQCQGFTPGQVNQINWQQIDFSEWIALLALGGQLPNLADINLDQLTGQGSSFNTNGLRQNASQRTQQRLNGIDVEALNYQGAVQLSGSGK